MKPTDEQQTLLEQHLAMVLEANIRTNLTTITDVEQARILHINDSLAGVELLDQAPAGPVVDLGSGAGFPGIPLAVVSKREITLVESVGKKARFLQDVVSELRLSNTVVYQGRAEELAVEQPQHYSVVTARALTQLPSLIELASPLLKDQGWLIAYKSSDVEQELNDARMIQEKLGMAYLKTQDCVLSDGTERTLIVFQKTGPASVKLPRRAGMAQKRPYTA